MLTSDKLKLDFAVLAQKLKAEFMPTLTEMEWSAHLLEKGFAVTVEPFAPDKGADLLAEHGGVPYYIEIRSVGPSEAEKRFDLLSADLFSRLKEIPSSYYVGVSLNVHMFD